MCTWEFSRDPTYSKVQYLAPRSFLSSCSHPFPSSTHTPHHRTSHIILLCYTLLLRNTKMASFAPATDGGTSPVLTPDAPLDASVDLLPPLASLPTKKHGLVGKQTRTRKSVKWIPTLTWTHDDGISTRGWQSYLLRILPRRTGRLIRRWAFSTGTLPRTRTAVAQWTSHATTARARASSSSSRCGRTREVRRCTMQPRRAAQGKRVVVVVADARVRSTPPPPRRRRGGG